MKKLTEIKNLNTELILNLGRENDFDLCTEVNECGSTLIQDEESLSQLLIELGVMFLANDENNMYYSLNDTFVAIPFETVEYDEDTIDIYLDFDELNIVNENSLVEDKSLIKIRNSNISSMLLCIVEDFLYENKVVLTKENTKTIKKGIEEYVKDIFKKENNHENLKKTVSFASEIIDILENVLSNEDIYIKSDERTGDPSEACIYGSIYYDLENTISNYLDCYITI